MRLLRRLHSVGNHRRLNRIIRIDEYDVLSPCDIQSGVARRGQSAVFFMNKADARVPHGVFIHDFRTTVPRSVVYKDEFKIRKCLRQNAVQTFCQILLDLIDRNDYADPTHFAFPLVFPI